VMLNQEKKSPKGANFTTIFVPLLSLARNKLERFPFSFFLGHSLCF
jgi:hypothetical protein